MLWTVQLDFIRINRDMPSATSYNLSRIGFESLERVKFSYRFLCRALWPWCWRYFGTNFPQLLMFWKLNICFFQMAIKADGYCFPGWDKLRTYISTEGDADKIVSYTNACFEYLCIKRLYLITVHDTVCLHNLESRLLHSIFSWFNLKTRTPETKMACFQRDQLYKNKRTFASPSYCSYAINW